MFRTTTWLALVLTSLPFAGCAIGAGGPHTHDDRGDGAEARVDGEALRSTFDEVDGWRISPALELSELAERAGVLVVLSDEDDAPVLEVSGDGGEWQALEITSSELGVHVGAAMLRAPASTVRVRVRADDALRVESLVWGGGPAVVEAADGGDDLEVSRALLSSDLTDLVRPRSAWSARASRGCSAETAAKYRFAIHHTEMGAGSDVRAALRSIQAFHMDSRGWCDVGYHFLVDQDGVIWEGRPLGNLGAHAGGANSGNIGISFIGCFDDRECTRIAGPRRPSEASIRAAGALVRRLAGRYRITVSTSTLKGHRDYTPTTCPGNNLVSRLEDIRRIGRGEGGEAPPPPPPPPPALPPIAVSWATLADGSFRFTTDAPANVSQVELVVDGFVIGRAPRGTVIDYAFSVARAERRLEARGLDAAGTQVARGVALLDVGDGVGVFIRQTGASELEIGLERAPAAVAAIEVRADGFVLTDGVSGATRSTRGAVRTRFLSTGSRNFEINTYGADGVLRGTLRRTFVVP